MAIHSFLKGINLVEIVIFFLQFHIVHMFRISIMQCKDSVSKLHKLYIGECVGLSYVQQWFCLAAAAAVIERVWESSELERPIYCIWFACCSPCLYVHAAKIIHLGQYLAAIISRCLQYITDCIKAKILPNRFRTHDLRRVEKRKRQHSVEDQQTTQVPGPSSKVAIQRSLAEDMVERQPSFIDIAPMHSLLDKGTGWWLL